MRLRYQKKIGIKPKHPKTFWLHISTILVNALNFAHETGQLLITQRRGIYFIKNWGPLTLLNCDYKIAAKTIANRINRVLPALISNDQTGFLKGRFVGEKIRLIDSLICNAKEQNILGLLLFLDFEKAFDTIEWYFFQNTLSFFCFGASVISQVNLFHSGPESCVSNNGWASDFFSIQRGVRQGSPLQPYLFILTAEVLAKAGAKMRI